MEESSLFCGQKLIDDLMNSSSSSDEEVELLAVLNYANLERQTDTLSEDEIIAITSAKIYEKGQENFLDNVINSLSEKDFKQLFHIIRESAIYLKDKYSLWYCNSSFRDNSNLQRTTVKANILSFLWFCANAVSFKSVAQLFNTSLSIIYQSFYSVLDFFMEVLAPEVLKFPSSYNEKEAVAKEFEKVAGFPNVLGCLATSYFPIKLKELSQKCGGSYIYLQGICDSNRRFLNVKIGLPKNKKELLIEKDLPKMCFPKYHLLGDTKYPIREQLIIPFDNNGNLSHSETNFNIKLCRTHVSIRKAFGILRSRFEQFKYLDFDNVETMSKFFVSCCIIHNICIDKQDLYDDEIYTVISDRLCNSFFATSQNDEFLLDLGLMKRFELKQILLKNNQ